MGNSDSKSSEADFIGFYIPVVGLAEHHSLIKTIWYMRDIRPAPYADHPDGDTLYVYITPPDREIAPQKVIRKSPFFSITNLIKNTNWYTNAYHLEHATQPTLTAKPTDPNTVPASPTLGMVFPQTHLQRRINYSSGYFVPDVRVKIPNLVSKTKKNSGTVEETPTSFQTIPTIHPDTDNASDNHPDLTTVCAVFRYPNTLVCHHLSIRTKT
jgi:hypothetical protein